MFGLDRIDNIMMYFNSLEGMVHGSDTQLQEDRNVNVVISLVSTTQIWKCYN